jgi:hypothetical protein
VQDYEIEEGAILDKKLRDQYVELFQYYLDNDDEEFNQQELSELLDDTQLLMKDLKLWSKQQEENYKTLTEYKYLKLIAVDLKEYLKELSLKSWFERKTIIVQFTDEWAKELLDSCSED